MYRLLVLIMAMFWLGLSHAEIVVKEATVRLLPPGVPNTSAYFLIENKSDKTVVLVGAKADFSVKAEIHNHVMEGDMMRMEQQSEVTLLPNQSLHFAPGGLHVMLFGLKQPLHEGQNVSIDLLTKQGSAINFSAEVARPQAQAHAHH